jgi:hypothetical protein
MPGNIWVFLACGGNSVSNASLVCDDWINVPLGIFMLSGRCAACLLVHDDVADKKLIVHPSSKMDVSSVVVFRSDRVQSKVNSN